MSDADTTKILEALKNGDKSASEKLLPLVYDELRRLAAQKMTRESPLHTLQPTALVHEAYLRLVGDGAGQWDSRGHFYAAAAEAMRRILIEAARRRETLKRGKNLPRVELTDEPPQEELTSPETLLALDEALKRLQQDDPDCYQLVMLRYFGGLTVDEAAAAMGVSPRTAKRQWAFARAWLQREIDSE